MPLALTCTCGARLEIDDKFAAQTINCPDCQKPLVAPALPAVEIGRRTSGLALASLILALVGAFTVIGTVAATLVGVFALLQIGRHSERLAGRGYAVAGIALGVVLTAGTVFALSSIELFGLSGLMSDANWAGKLDFPAALEVQREEEGFAIKRPSRSWGILKQQGFTAAGDWNQRIWDDLLLVLPTEDAIVLCYAVRVSADDGIEKCRERFRRDFRNMSKVGLATNGGRFSPASMSVTNVKRPPKKDNIDMIELQIDKRSSGEDKTYLARIFKRDDDDRMYVLVAGVANRRFNRLEGQFREALDSFRLLDRNAWPDR